MRVSFDVRQADGNTLSKPELKPMTIVSADSHVSLPPKMYKEYLDPKYYGSWDRFMDDIGLINKVVELQGYPFPPEALEVSLDYLLSTLGRRILGGFAAESDALLR